MIQETEYIRKLNHSSLLLTAEGACEEETDSIEMFHYNKIPYFLNMQRQVQDGKTQFSYDITGKRPLDQMLEVKALEHTLLKKIFFALAQACIQAENYMLSEDDIVLKPELIFLDVSTDRILFCYVPQNQCNIRQQFCEFMEYLLQRLDHKDEAAVQLAYGVYQKIRDEAEGLFAALSQIQTEKMPLPLPDGKEPERETYGYADFAPEPEREEKRREEISAEETIKKKKKEKAVDLEEMAVKEPVKKQATEKIKSMIKKKLYTDSYRDMEDAPVYEPEAETEEEPCHPTVCLAQDMEGQLNRFVYQGMDRSRDFQCAGERLIVGSSQKESDICIPLPVISRVHAKIELSGQGTFIEDLNSTNGTLVNGEMIKYRERRMLKSGDIISFAGEAYSFH